MYVVWNCLLRGEADLDKGYVVPLAFHIMCDTYACSISFLNSSNSITQKVKIEIN